MEHAGPKGAPQTAGRAACWVLAAAAFLALLAVFAAANVGAAPGPEVTITGTVRDPQGPVPGAVVRVAQTDNKTASGPDGSFVLRGVQATGTVTVTAWAASYYVGWTALHDGTPELTAGKPFTVTLRPHYTGDNPRYTWFSFEGVKGSASCGLCHTANPEWEADAHSQAATNPRFLSMYSGTDVQGRASPPTRYGDLGKALPPDPAQPYYGPGWRLDYSNRAGNCATCHTPMASKIPNTQNCGWLGCHTSVTVQWSQGIVPPAPMPLDLAGDAAEGIHCDFCHKIGDVYLDPETKLPPADMPGILSYRLYRPAGDDQLFFGTFDDIPRRDTYLPLEKESAFCAPCHYGVFGGVVGAGHVAGGTLIYNSYGEWLDSPYSNPDTGRTCQDCHMPAVNYNYIVFPERGGKERPSDQIHSHYMPGAADEQLLQNAVTLSTTARLSGGQVVADVTIVNDKTGHHVPTDAPLRHLILLVEARDESGRLLALSSGPVLPKWTGDYAGRPGRAYAKILRDEWTGEAPTAAYWRPVTIVADTRLAAFAVDRSRYTFTLPPGSGAVRVEARLVYRRAFQTLMAQKGWTDPDIVMEQGQAAVGTTSVAKRRTWEFAR